MTTKQELFIVEYLKDFNATQAAIRAGYSENTAYSIGQENLNKPEIKEAIENKINEVLGDKNKYLARLIRYWAKVMDSTASKDSDRLKASELLGKYAGAFVEKVQISDSNGEPIQIGITFKHAKEDKGND